MPPRILFVCLGNICRSPLAEGILVRDAERRGVPIEVDSAGIGSWHVGDRPDSRAQSVGIEIGCRMDMRARQVHRSDFRNFDAILAMDRMNYRDLLAWDGSVPERIHLARTFAGETVDVDVPDPYYGDLSHFRRVAAMLEAVSSGLLDQIEAGKLASASR